MSKKANPTVIGAFIVGAIAIMTILTLLLSGNLFSKDKVEAIMYFEGSVTGLNIGAPVKFRGVKVGTVTDIKLIFDRNRDIIQVPVIVELDRSSYLVKFKDKMVRASEVFVDTEKFAKQGLHAQLKLNSILTGQLYIELEFSPGTEFKFRGDGKMREIPTTSTALQEITKTLENYPIHEVLNNIASTMASIDKIFSDPIILETINSINQTSKDYGVLAKQLNSETKVLSADLKSTLVQAEKTFKQADQSLIIIDETIKTTGGLLREDSQLMYSLQDTLNEVADAARSVRTLADTLEQQPESLLRGKSAGGK